MPEEINRFTQEPRGGEECPRYQYRQYTYADRLITIGVNECETEQIEEEFRKKLQKEVERIDREIQESREEVTIINEEGEEVPI